MHPATAHGVGSSRDRPRQYSVGTRVVRGNAPFDRGSRYVNQIGLETDEGSERIKAAYGANYDRLVGLKNKYDLSNLFRHNRNIRPRV